MSRNKKFYAIIVLFMFASVCGHADTIVGIVKSLADLHDAYEKIQSAKKILDDADKDVRPSLGALADASKIYQSAVGNLSKVATETSKSESTASVEPLINCAVARRAITRLHSEISSRSEKLRNINSENAALLSALEEIDKTFDAANTIEKGIPSIAAVPIWGSSAAAEIFSNVQDMRRSAGTARYIVDKRKRDNAAHYANIESNVRALSAELEKAYGFKSAPQPPGSYIKTCVSCHFDCDLLECDCRRINGEYNRTSVQYSLCNNVENNNGRLRCAP